MEPTDNPYASPEDMVPSRSRRKKSWTSMPFASAHTRGLIARTTIVGNSLGSALTVPVLVPLLDSEAENEAANSLVVQGATLGVLVFLAIAFCSGIAYCFWIHRAYRNLPSLGLKRPGHTPGWAVGSYFVPILNLFRPWEIMCEIWKYSSPPQASQAEHSPRQRVSCAIVGWWWGFYLASSFLAQGDRVASIARMDVAETATFVHWWDVGQVLANLTAAALIVVIIGRVDSNQLERHELRSQLEPVEPVEPQY